MVHQYQTGEPPDRGQYYVPDEKHVLLGASSLSPTGTDSKRWRSLVSQVSRLNDRFLALEEDSRKQYDALNNSTKLQLQLITERVNNLESKYKVVANQLHILLNQTEIDPSAVSGTVRNKLETISKQMAELFKDITKLSDSSAAPGSNTVSQTPSSQQSLPTLRDVVLDLQNPSTVDSTALSLHQMPNMATTSSAALMDLPVSLRGHQPSSTKLTGLSTSLSSISTGQILIQDHPTPAEANILDLKWSKQLGVPSPSIPSPYNTKSLTLDYPYSMTRNTAFQKQLTVLDFDRKRPSTLDKTSQTLESVADFPEPPHPAGVITPYELDPLTEFSGIITSDRKKRKTSKLSDSSSTSPAGLLKHDAPQFKLEKNAKTVEEIWNEWEYGVNGKPPLKMLESKYSARWRNDTESRTFVRRKKIYLAIETGKSRGFNEEEIIHELENSRCYVSNGTIKKKPLLWLYNNIPQKYQSD